MTSNRRKRDGTRKESAAPARNHEVDGGLKEGFERRDSSFKVVGVYAQKFFALPFHLI